MESKNDADNVKIVAPEVIEEQAAKEKADASTSDVKEEEEEVKSPKRRLGDRGRDKKKRKPRFPNGMPEYRLEQLAKAREKALRVRKERAAKRKAEKKRDMEARYNKPAPPEPTPPVQQRQASQPIPIPQSQQRRKPTREEATQAFFWVNG
eukprot:g6411.t1